MVTWIKPLLLFTKFNSDESCINENYGRRGVIRTGTRHLVMAYSILMGRGISEAEALLFSLK